MRFAAFDIETAGPAPTDESGRYNLGITCAAISYLSNFFVGIPESSSDGRFRSKMSPADVDRFIQDLCRLRADGYKIASINGLGFDFRVLAEECGSQENYENVKDLALNHYDPGFQMLCTVGWMQGLAGFAAGADVEGKTKGMDGLKAVEMWQGSREDQDRVIEYVKQDALATKRICRVFEYDKMMRWVSRNGHPGALQIDRLLTVKECLELPLPTTPRWVCYPWPRDKFAGWLKEGDDK